MGITYAHINTLMGNCNTATSKDNSIITDTHRFLSAQDDTWMEGDWISTKDCCSFGYKGVWEITFDSVNRDEIILEEQHASCCTCVPCICCICCMKRGCLQHRMIKVAENEWRGTLGCKPMSLIVVSDQQLSHLTTDGYFTLTRRDTTTTTKYNARTTEKHGVVDIKTEKGALLPPSYMPEDTDVEGLWKVTRDIDVGGHYKAEWEILADGDDITITQQRGTCCWKLFPDSVFNRCGRPCHMKVSTQTLSKAAPGRWEGHFLCQTLTLTVVSENELCHSLGFPEGSYTLTRN